MPKRSTLALKNRYSALRARASQVHSAREHRPGLDATPSTNNTARRSNRTKCDAFDVQGAELQHFEDQSDDEDPEEEEEDYPDDFGSDGVATEISMDPNWPSNVPSSMNTATQTAAFPMLGADQLSPFRMPTTSNIQQTIDPTSLSVSQWNEEHQFSSVSHPFPSGFVQNDNPVSTLQAPTLPDYGISMGTDHKYTGPVDLYPNQHGYDPASHAITLSVNNPTPGETSDLAMDWMNSAAPQEQPTMPDKSPPAQHGMPQSQSATKSSMPQQRQVSKGSTSSSSPRLSAKYSWESQKARSSSSEPIPSNDDSPGSILHRVSIDAECTADQVGHVMSSLMGVTRKVVVKVSS